MASINDVPRLLSDISADRPCGDDAWPWVDAWIKPLIDVRPPAQPNWSEVARRCELTLRGEPLEGVDRAGGKDLRVAVHLTRAWAAMEGLGGVRAGLLLIRELLDRFVATLYPINPNKRVSVLEWLCPQDGGSTDLRPALVRAPLAVDAQGHAYSLRDIQLATGRRTAIPGESAPSRTDVDLAFEQMGAAGLEVKAGHVAQILAEIDAVRKSITRSGATPESAPLALLKDSVGEIQTILAEQLTRIHGGPPMTQVSSALTEMTATPPADGKPAASATAPPPPAGLRSRSEVIASLDQLCMYYRTQEPSSLVVYLLDQARAWVGKSYLEIFSDLSFDPSDKGKTLLLAIRPKDGGTAKPKT